MPRLYDVHEHVELDEPVLVVALEGWIDAGLAAANAVTAIREQVDLVHVVTFNADELLDFRARRPTMHLVDGVNTGLTWASTELHAIRQPGGQDLLLLTGVEPDHSWHSFVDAVLDIADDYEVRMQVGLGAYPAGAPHTRPVTLSATSSTDALAATIGYLRGTIEVPAGVEAAIERGCAEQGIPAVGIWAQVPHYAAAMRYPAATVALLEGLNTVTGTDFETGHLAADVQSSRDRIDALLSSNPEHMAMVREAEKAYDLATPDPDGSLPSGDDLAADFERFLREQDGDGG